MLRSSFVFAVVLLVPLAAAPADRQPVPKAGGSCPIGYVETGGGAYCKPLASSRGGAIERKGPSCPSGSRQDGAYCIQIGASLDDDVSPEAKNFSRCFAIEGASFARRNRMANLKEVMAATMKECEPQLKQLAKVRTYTDKEALLISEALAVMLDKIVTQARTTQVR